MVTSDTSRRGHVRPASMIRGVMRPMLPLLAILIAAGDVYEWRLGHATQKASLTHEPSLDSVGQWLPMCTDSPRGHGCHVLLSFRFAAGPGGEQFGILGFSDNYSTITAPIRRFTTTSWRVDGHPFAETVSAEGDGAVLSHGRTVALIEQMLTGKELTVRFVESGTGRVVERVFPLTDFPNAYARYQELQHRLATAKSV